MRTELNVDHAHSMDNGIRFYSKRHKKYVAIATIDEQGIITTEWTTMKKYKKHNKQVKKAERIKSLKIILGILPFAIILYLLMDWSMSIDPIYGIRTLLIGYAFMLLGSFITNASIEGRKEKNAYKFHSAEHMVLNAYRKLKRVPTLEEIRQYSRFSNTCGTNNTTQLAISFILMFGCSFIPNLLYRMIAMYLVNIVVLILLQCGLLNFLQKLTTTTPTDTELLVAIEGMNVWYENEKKEKEKSKFFKFLHRLFPRVFN